MDWRTRSCCEITSKPLTRAVPPEGRSRVHSMLMVVVLPAPLGPRKPKISSSCTWKLTPSTATKSPKRRTRPSTSMAFMLPWLLSAAGTWLRWPSVPPPAKRAIQAAAPWGLSIQGAGGSLSGRSAMTTIYRPGTPDDSQAVYQVFVRALADLDHRMNLHLEFWDDPDSVARLWEPRKP